jgi:hypothetical protein
MKKGPDGAESCSRPKRMRAWIHTVFPPLCRACGLSIRFESHFHPSWLQLNQILFPRYRLPFAVPPTPILRILAGHMIPACSPARMCSVTMCSVTKRSDSSSPEGMEFFSIPPGDGPNGATFFLPSPGSVEIDKRYLEPNSFEKLDEQNRWSK